MNPQSEEKIDQLIDLLKISPDSRIIDIGCGKGEFLIRLAEKVSINATGVDLSPFTIKEAKERTAKRVPNAQIEYIESDGKVYLDSLSKYFDLSFCMGASWIFGGHEGTLKALSKITHNHGIIIVGEPYWIKQPTEWYLEISEIKLNDYGTHTQNVEIGENLGLRLMYVLTSNYDDWDRYEMLQSLAVDNYVINNPDDPDNEELLARVSKYRKAYLREGRDVFGWALYVFRKLE
jgi:SAM-dependent methyltransferase